MANYYVAATRGTPGKQCPHYHRDYLSAAKCLRELQYRERGWVTGEVIGVSRRGDKVS